MKTKLLPVIAVLLSLLTATALAGKKAPSTSSPKQVAISVTSDGFQPTEIKTKAGEPLRLVVTRTTEKTCAKEIVIQDLGIRAPLPLNQPVAIDITPKTSGKLRYACSMDMVAGVIVVE